MTSTEKPPSFVSVETATEKPVSCTVHGPSQTPHLDRELQLPYAQAMIQALTAALNDLTDEKKCTQCALERTSTLLASHVQEIQSVKKNGQWSKGERKALKAELKTSLKGVKKDAKALWSEGMGGN
ncbi:hypothetical protein BDW42DRAFT_169002 [Aspergillus taichungensis]|uniref:Uncharacterized protein n=1 Tax=Aspergillus taichungensis TaxID=482145 RepID=A0A2J5HVW7_9EURO|nr:hypothetical protein BDW42DRAFT_169002 [Aspergillus taichungensis]